MLCSRGLDENKARWFFQQLILALDYCHKMNISNRDIKLENTLLHSQGADRRPMVKLCDFGVALSPPGTLRAELGSLIITARETCFRYEHYIADGGPFWAIGGGNCLRWEGFGSSHRLLH